MPAAPGNAAPGTAPRLAVLLAILFWGVSFVATKAALRELSPFTLITVRFGIGWVLLFALMAVRRRTFLPPVDAIRPLLLMGFLGVFLHQTTQAWALTMTSAVHAGWLISVTPIWSALLAAMVLGERFSRSKTAGLVLGFAGAMLVITRGQFDATLLVPSTRGDLLILASTLNWAIYTVVGHATIRRLGPHRATALSMLFGWIMVIPFFVASRGWTEIPALSGPGWTAVAFLGIACSGLGYLFWYYALERLEATRVAAMLYLEPLVTLAASVAILGEPIETSSIVGGLIVLAGVAMVQAGGARGQGSGVRDRG